MPSAARAYSAQPQRKTAPGQRKTQRQPRSNAQRGAAQHRASQHRADVRVVAGSAAEPLPPAVKTFVGIFMAFVAMFAVLACLRIGLTAATVSKAVANEGMSTQINEMLSYSASLEVQESTLANPAHVRSVASGRLGMVMPGNAVRLDLGFDAVRYNEDGSLSLASSLAAASVG